MQAGETKLQELLEGVKQFVIPLFQRSYTWGDRREWQTLWDDIMELYEQDYPRTHFIGSIVNMPTNSVPEGVNKYLVIDGQQRLTTFFILLALLRDRHKSNHNFDKADEINETLLVNKFKKDSEFFKLMPTQKNLDRDAFFGIINRTDRTEQFKEDNRILKAYSFFERKIRQNPDIDLEKLFKVITTYLSIVSITLDPNDNPYLVFESLNAKGTPLNHADLIRNYFFMRIHINKQEVFYKELWEPMEKRLGDNLTEFIRHYLMSDGVIVNKSDVYFSLKESLNGTDAEDYLKRLNKFSEYYEKLLNPFKEDSVKISNYLVRLNRIEVTTAYPLLLNFYDYYDQGLITEENYTSILFYLENYLIRRFISNKPTRELNKIFPSIIKSIQKTSGNLELEFKNLLSSKGYPKDYEFEMRFLSMKFYGGADLVKKTKLILESIELSYNHRERPTLDNFTIEHIMPQTITPAWKELLGEDWETTHEIYLNSIGNLTLSAYNTELSNKVYDEKRTIYLNSNIQLNKYFEQINTWNKNEIENRTRNLFIICNKIWYYFGVDNIFIENSDVTGKSPFSVTILNQSFLVNNWRAVLTKTLEVINDLEPDMIELIEKEFPRYVGKSKDVFRDSKMLGNGTYYEVNLSAASINRLCNQIIDTIGLTSDDWVVMFE